jgi:short-subunit dehydrogenase
VSQTFRTAIVVGASSGIGLALAEQLAASGCRVAAIARRKDRLDELAARFPNLVVPFAHDVTEFTEVPELFQQITSELGGLDLIIYASGIMPEVGKTEFNTEKDIATINVNVLGAIAWLNQAAIRFQGSQTGTIIGIGSVAGDRGRPGQPVYNTSKAALSTFLEALRNRLSKLGVVVINVKPGPVDTEMTRHLGFKNAISASDAARIILTKTSRSREYYLEPKHHLIFAIIRRLPSWIMQRLGV